MPKPETRESDRSSLSGSHDEPDLRLTTSHRLVQSKLFAETFAQQTRWAGRYMVLWRRRGANASLRLGVITSKKLHLRANKRNRARRRLREAYRQTRPYLSGDFDVLLIGRRSILYAEWNDILKELLKLATKAKLITPENRTRAEEQHGLR